ncbi:MAG: septum formation protein Maf [Bradymonadaceae bacterium]|nr:septum formation protein Maf [Lujinxingiaceae bacterium]
MNHKLILASGSGYKQELLTRLALPFEALSAEINERPQSGEVPDAIARRLAREKALAVHALQPEAFVIGADQIIALGGAVFSKPGSLQDAEAQLRRLSGHVHDLFTAVAVVAPDGTVFEDLVHFAMDMRAISSAEITAYVGQDLPTDCAGAYKIEAGGIRLFRSLQGDDYTAIVGLPLTRVWRLLEAAGYFP